MSTTTLHDINEGARRMRRSVSWIYHNKNTIKCTQTHPGAPIYFTDEQIDWNIAAAERGPAEKARPQRTAKPQTVPRPQVTTDASVVPIRKFVARPEAARGGRKKRAS